MSVAGRDPGVGTVAPEARDADTNSINEICILFHSGTARGQHQSVCNTVRGRRGWSLDMEHLLVPGQQLRLPCRLNRQTAGSSRGRPLDA